MRIQRSPSPRTYIAPNLTDAHIAAAIADPGRVVLQEEGTVIRIVGLTYPIRDGRGLVIFAPEAPWDDPALLEVVYQDQGNAALVIFAAEADEEELERWINS